MDVNFYPVAAQSTFLWGPNIDGVLAVIIVIMKRLKKKKKLSKGWNS